MKKFFHKNKKYFSLRKKTAQLYNYLCNIRTAPVLNWDLQQKQGIAGSKSQEIRILMLIGLAFATA
jgi:hypothetical protein